MIRTIDYLALSIGAAAIAYSIASQFANPISAILAHVTALLT